jgi:hypothetical protein
VAWSVQPLQRCRSWWSDFGTRAVAIGGGFMITLVPRLSVFHTCTESGAPAVVDGCESTAAEHDLSLPPFGDCVLRGRIFVVVSEGDSAVPRCPSLSEAVGSRVLHEVSTS